MSRITKEEVASWREAYDLTPTQVAALAALMSAQLLGYDGATAKALRWLGLSSTEVHAVYAMRHAGLVEIAGYIDGKRESVFRASSRAFRRLGVQLPRPIPPVVQTDVGRAEMMAEREQRRRQERTRRWNERQKLARRSA